MSRPKDRQDRDNKKGRDLRGTPPIAGQNRTDPETSAQDPMAGREERRMKREGHDMGPPGARDSRAPK